MSLSSYRLWHDVLLKSSRVSAPQSFSANPRNEKHIKHSFKLTDRHQPFHIHNSVWSGRLIHAERPRTTDLSTNCHQDRQETKSHRLRLIQISTSWQKQGKLRISFVWNFLKYNYVNIKPNACTRQNKPMIFLSLLTSNSVWQQSINTSIHRCCLTHVCLCFFLFSLIPFCLSATVWHSHSCHWFVFLVSSLYPSSALRIEPSHNYIGNCHRAPLGCRGCLDIRTVIHTELLSDSLSSGGIVEMICLLSPFGFCALSSDPSERIIMRNLHGPAGWPVLSACHSD